MRIFLLTLFIVTCSAYPASAQLQFDRTTSGLTIKNGQTKVVEYVHTDANILRPHFTRAHSHSGILLTRANPPVAGVDAVDHPTMHPGIWLAFGDINGQDFWRNKARIEHVRYVEEPKLDQDRMSFATENHLVSAEGTNIGALTNRMLVTLRPSGTLIIWQATLTAKEAALKLGDQEEMGFGVRMATPLTEKKVGSSPTVLDSSRPARLGDSPLHGAITQAASMVAKLALPRSRRPRTCAPVGGTTATTVCALPTRSPKQP